MYMIVATVYLVYLHVGGSMCFFGLGFLMFRERYSDVNYKSFLPGTHKKLNINTEYCGVKIIVEHSEEFISKFPTN